MIRHARPWAASPAILPLAVAMIETAFQAALMPAVGAAVLLETGLGAAAGAAISLAPITLPADPEHRTASDAATNALPQKRIARHGHVRPQTGLDKGS